ncbi:hypothetical protein DOT98_10495 [Clavibacter michiganensis subsp. michiganensis]|nr:hypothetical protein [Clavibacter michiganensis subsp. michiganensis]MWJ47635.1 hypothetical protein [Clavibacter michiganensis subsp. michiganensis]
MRFGVVFDEAACRNLVSLSGFCVRSMVMPVLVSQPLMSFPYGDDASYWVKLSQRVSESGSDEPPPPRGAAGEGQACGDDDGGRQGGAGARVDHGIPL